MGARSVGTAVSIILKSLVIELCPFGVDSLIGGESNRPAGATVSAGAGRIVIPAFEAVTG